MFWQVIALGHDADYLGNLDTPSGARHHPQLTAHTGGVRSRSRTGPRPGENTRPPRYRLLTAAAALPQRKPVEPTEAFERDCPSCGTPVLFTQVHGDTGVEYLIEDHECRDR